MASLQDQFIKIAEEEKVWEAIGELAGQFLLRLERIAVVQEKISAALEELVEQGKRRYD